MSRRADGIGYRRSFTWCVRDMTWGLQAGGGTPAFLFDPTGIAFVSRTKRGHAHGRARWTEPQHIESDIFVRRTHPGRRIHSRIAALQRITLSRLGGLLRLED